MSDLDSMDHLVNVVGLCSVPKDSWTAEDHRVLREAREFIQNHHQKEKKFESEDETRGASTPGKSGEGESCSDFDGEVPANGDLVEEGFESPPEPGEAT
jgi:hypothetical protein